jgi:hypothetical protein
MKHHVTTKITLTSLDSARYLPRAIFPSHLCRLVAGPQQHALQLQLQLQMQLRNTCSCALQVERLTAWAVDRAAGRANITTNMQKQHKDLLYDVLHCWHSRLQPASCFNATAYLSMYPDLPFTCNDADSGKCWSHFVEHGIIEGRYGRFSCDMRAAPDLGTYVAAPLPNL